MSQRILGLLILAFSITSYAQSLGDVARQVRAERQQKGPSVTKVITNDDIVTGTSQMRTTNEGEESAPTANSADGTDKGVSSGEEAKTANKKDDAAKEREAQELETQKRTNEINKEYRDRIAGIRVKIDTAQTELVKLEREQIDSTNDFRRTSGISPSIPTYEQQQRAFSEQIQAQRNLITSLHSQLEDTQEAARHAGVPRALD